RIDIYANNFQIGYLDSNGFHMTTDIATTGAVHAGNARMAGDGNIWGTRWNAQGQWLWDAIVTQLNTRATTDYVNQTFVRDMRLGSPGTIILRKPNWNVVPGGCAFTGWFLEGDEPVNDTIQYKPIQVLVNGAWRTIAG
ncbi:TPA: hypothetical protein I8Y21_006275, partial [Klebsiella oxytoca]|nr:hypothetical protein [Klebsiella oxytoca]